MKTNILNQPINESEARKIGTQFLQKRGLDINPYGGKDKLGEAIDYNIFFLFPIVASSGDSYIGGILLLIDKRRKFCLLIASSPNFCDYHIRLFRLIIIHQLYDRGIDYNNYRSKKKHIDHNDFVGAIFLLLNSHPDSLNAFIEFLDIIILIEDESSNNQAIERLRYRALSFNLGTIELFLNGLQLFETESLVKPRLTTIKKLLAEKQQSIKDLEHRYKLNLQEELEEIEEIKRMEQKMKAEESKNSL